MPASTDLHEHFVRETEYSHIPVADPPSSLLACISLPRSATNLERFLKDERTRTRRAPRTRPGYVPPRYAGLSTNLPGISRRSSQGMEMS